MVEINCTEKTALLKEDHRVKENSLKKVLGKRAYYSTNSEVDRKRYNLNSGSSKKLAFFEVPR